MDAHGLIHRSADDVTRVALPSVVKLERAHYQEPIQKKPRWHRWHFPVSAAWTRDYYSSQTVLRAAITPTRCQTLHCYVDK